MSDQATKIFGIDLGTAYSSIALVDEHVQHRAHPETRALVCGDLVRIGLSATHKPGHQGHPRQPHRAPQ